MGPKKRQKSSSGDEDEGTSAIDNKKTRTGKRISHHNKTPPKDDEDPKYSCRLCSHLVELYLLEEIKVWWQRLLLYTTYIYHQLMSPERAKFGYHQALTHDMKKTFKDPQRYRFYICWDHLPHIGKQVLDMLKVKHPNDIKNADQKLVNKVLKIANKIGKRTITRHLFLGHCDQFVSHVWWKTKEHYFPNLREPNEVSVASSRQRKKNNRDREEASEKNADTTLQEEPVLKTLTIAQEIIPVQEQNLEIEIHPEETERRGRDMTPEDFSEKFLENVINRDIDEVERTFERQDSEDIPTPKNDSRTLKLSVDTFEEPSTSRKSPFPKNRVKECKICKGRGRIIEVSGAWSKRIVLHSAFVSGLFPLQECSQLYDANRRLNTCSKHLISACEDYFDYFGTHDPKDFLKNYENRREIVNDIITRIQELFNLDDVDIIEFIKEIRYFVQKYSKESEFSKSPPPQTGNGSLISSEKSSATISLTVEPAPVLHKLHSSINQNSGKPGSMLQRKKLRKNKETGIKCRICGALRPPEEMRHVESPFFKLALLTALYFDKKVSTDDAQTYFSFRRLSLCSDHVTVAASTLLTELGISNPNNIMDVMADKLNKVMAVMATIQNQSPQMQIQAFFSGCISFFKRNWTAALPEPVCQAEDPTEERNN